MFQLLSRNAGHVVPTGEQGSAVLIQLSQAKDCSKCVPVILLCSTGALDSPGTLEHPGQAASHAHYAALNILFGFFPVFDYFE